MEKLRKTPENHFLTGGVQEREDQTEGSDEATSPPAGAVGIWPRQHMAVPPLSPPRDPLAAT